LLKWFSKDQEEADEEEGQEWKGDGVLKNYNFCGHLLFF